MLCAQRLRAVTIVVVNVTELERYGVLDEMLISLDEYMSGETSGWF